MKLKVIHTENAPAAIGPYSQAIAHAGTLYISGQIPFDPKTGALVSEDVVLQTKQCIENAKAIAQSAGATLNDVIKTTVFVRNMDEFGKINEIYGHYFTDHKPARACVEVSRLPKDVKVEIEMIVSLQD
ncbi:MAG: RidA family protein [Clostridia bacterium]